jgi:hypothetical protein
VTIGIIAIGALALAIWLGFALSKKEKEESEKQEKSLDDELIYDPVTGRKMTLEEAENEVINIPDSVSRIKSEQEIEENYSDDEKEIEYITRDVIKSNIPESNDDRIIDLITYSGIFESTRSFAVQQLWEIKPDNFIGLVDISYTYSFGRSDSLAFESQLIGILQKNTITKEINGFGRIDLKEIDNTIIVRLPYKARYRDFKKLFGYIQPNDSNLLRAL